MSWLRWVNRMVELSWTKPSIPPAQPPLQFLKHSVYCLTNDRASPASPSTPKQAHRKKVFLGTGIRAY